MRTAGRCLVMGILNVTPDSFSDGGRWTDPASATGHGLALAEAGADLVDVGGESTRPGAQRVSAATEQQRVLPVVTELAAAGVAVSVDTMNASTAAAAVAAGACVVNDVSGGLADPDMLAAVAATSAAFVAMHWRAHSQGMDDWAQYSPDPAGDVIAELSDRVAAATDARIAPERLVLDPGLGFAKEAHHNWALLSAIPRLRRMGFPLLIGASRKRFLGALLASGSAPRPVDQRDAATDAVSTIVAAAGGWAVRVHDVAGTADAVRVVAALQQVQQQVQGEGVVG